MENVLDVMERKKQASDLKGETHDPKESTSSTKENVVERHLQPHFAAVTPEKPIEASLSNSMKEAELLLPHKYKILLDFLDRMVSSLRLLALSNKPPTFHNISRQVEIFTKRKFEYKHLAQIKHLLPEAVNIEKMLMHNAETLCLNPEIKITLSLDIVEGCREESVFIALHNLLVSRLKAFLDKQLEASDIPEAELPFAYSQRDATINREPLPLEDTLTSSRTEVMNSSHFSPSHAPYFVERGNLDIAETTGLNPVSLPSSSLSIGEEIRSERTIRDSSSKPMLEQNMISSSRQDVGSSTLDRTPLKFVSESGDLMLETPALSTPKRVSSSTVEGKQKTLITQTCTSCNQTAKRSLDFSKLDEGEENSLNLNPTLYEVDQTESLLDTSTQMEMKEKTVSASYITSSQDKVSIFCGGKDNEIIPPAHEQTSVGLSEFAVSIQKLFQSVNLRAMTKDELFQKIIMNNFEFDEEGHIEQKLEILEKLVPGWLSKKRMLSGDLTYSLKMVPDLHSILEMATTI
ncbi:OLC1v1011978C1 [Oldenlandia corymbosa var. corymbosa]|uniref:OLC1v1011978C1 n=1 Tax=Oldenlandia corymbosa var. corymbosa TaxID=529605 RepID=A0AAV1DX53_OLDCO|nr:OLC1v1011978C1 [Oldenlandia corymbosa var. corymbosa]